LRNNNSDWLLGFSDFIGISTSLSVELYAVLNGLEIAQAKEFRNIIIESYSTLAVDFASHGTSQPHPYAPLIQKKCHVCMGDWKKKLSILLKREMNVSTDLRKLELPPTIP